MCRRTGLPNVIEIACVDVVPVPHNSVVTKTSQLLNVLSPLVDTPSTCEYKQLYHLSKWLLNVIVLHLLTAGLTNEILPCAGTVPMLVSSMPHTRHLRCVQYFYTSKGGMIRAVKWPYKC